MRIANTILIIGLGVTMAQAQFNLPKDLNRLKRQAQADSSMLHATTSAAATAVTNDLLDVLDLGSGRGRIVLLGGLRMLTGKRDLVRIEYIDQSPSRDYMSTLIDLSGNGLVTALTLYYERENEGWSWQAGVDGFVDSYWSVAFFAGYAKHLVANDAFTLKAGARLSYGLGQVHLGNVRNNSIYFQIGSQQIYDRELSLTYRDNYVALMPNATFEKRLGDRLGVIASLAATVGVRTKAVIAFRGTGSLPLGASASDPAEVALGDVNLTMTQAGQRIEKLPLSYSGATLSLGLTWSL